MPKTYVDTYIFKQYPVYEQKLYEFILKAERIDTNSAEFEDIMYDIKRRKISDVLVKILASDNVVLGILPGNSLPKTFKVFVAKDTKEAKGKVKVFIDVSECIDHSGGVYVCRNLEWLISYVINAMVSFVYFMAPNRVLGNSTILKEGGDAFCRLFTYIIDRMYKISSVRQLYDRVKYLAAVYYQVNLLGKDFDKNYDSIIANAIRIADIEKRDALVVDAMCNKSDFNDFNSFINAFTRFGFKDIKVSAVIDFWMKSFGTGTVFGVEYFPIFSAMLTDTYIGGYLNQQVTIEKITGSAMVAYAKTILQIGESVA